MLTDTGRRVKPIRLSHQLTQFSVTEMSGRWTENGHGVGHKSPMLGTFFVRKTGWPNVPHLTFFPRDRKQLRTIKWIQMIFQLLMNISAHAERRLFLPQISRKEIIKQLIWRTLTIKTDSRWFPDTQFTSFLPHLPHYITIYLVFTA